jgi:hypothetical protein
LKRIHLYEEMREGKKAKRVEEWEGKKRKNVEAFIAQW